jgi:hypothetical protein
MLEPTGIAYVSARQEERREFDSGIGFSVFECSCFLPFLELNYVDC